jgi:ketosteroid isomerase-like protein
MTQNSNETQIRALVEKWASAVRTKDMNSVLANHADDTLSGTVQWRESRETLVLRDT